MKKFIKNLLANWVLKNYPFNVTTQVNKFNTIYLKKGKIREWRTYDSFGQRVPLMK